MGRRILASLLSMALIFALPVFSLADDSTANLKNSGSVVNSVAFTAESTEISMMAMRSVAASEGVALTAAEGDSGQFGYNIEPYLADLNISFFGIGSSGRFYNFYYTLPEGQYLIDAVFSDTFSSFGAYMYPDSSVSIVSSRVITDKSVRAVINVPNTGRIGSTFGVRSGSTLPIDSFIVSFKVSTLTPVEGISSGYTYSSGIISKTTRSIFETLTPSFGNQPAGKYLVNIYHWGDSYDVDFHISDSTESYYLPTSTNCGVTTLVYNHPGGDFTLDGNFTASNIETSVIEGDVDFNGNTSYGDIVADGPLSWVFNITDIVAIPYETAADHNFGFFAPIIGFFNDHFSSMKSWIAAQIDKIAGDDETQADVDQAQDSLNKEVEELGQLSTDLTTQTGNLEQQFTTDFAIPSEVLGQTGAVQQIYNFLFSSLGIFSIFIWLPVVLAVIKKLLRL